MWGIARGSPPRGSCSSGSGPRGRRPCLAVPAPSREASVLSLLSSECLSTHPPPAQVAPTLGVVPGIPLLAWPRTGLPFHPRSWLTAAGRPSWGQILCHLRSRHPPVPLKRLSFRRCLGGSLGWACAFCSGHDLRVLGWILAPAPSRASCSARSLGCFCLSHALCLQGVCFSLSPHPVSPLLILSLCLSNK